MFFRMVGELGRWLLLLAVTLLAFGACFHALFEGQTSECLFGASFGSDMTVLLEFILGVDPEFDCLHDSQTSVSAPAVLFAFLLLVGVLLMNMLIAMLAKTFDTVHEAQAVNWQVRTTRRKRGRYHGPF